MHHHVAAVDVGTGSARAGIFDVHGTLLGRGEHPIFVRRPQENHAEHSSQNIWSAVCAAVKAAILAASVPPSAIAAIGFDATCSLVVRGRAGQSLTVSTTGETELDTIVWLDHRALKQADFCTATGHEVLDFSGGSLSPEMQMPKLMWLKEHLPQTWAEAGHFFDLADFLTWKATGSTARSRCTLSAKWNYLSHRSPPWQMDYLDQLGIGDVLVQGQLPETTASVGQSIGRLTEAAADELGLTSACHVSAGMIDAYAGSLGVLGRYAGDLPALERQVALIAGTSSCIVGFSQRPKPTKGMWGPYFEALLPECWLVEAGQSATGALLDHIVSMHASGGEPSVALHGRIIERISQLREIEGESFGDRIQVLPDFHGNRSPLADPHLTGMISGLTLDRSFDNLCRMYWRSGVGIALGMRHILEAMREHGYAPDTLHISGGHVKNPMLLELYGDVTGCKVVLSQMNETVLLGTAMGAAVASGLYADLASAGQSMSAPVCEFQPNHFRRAIYDRDYRKYKAMVQFRSELEALA